MIKTRKKNPPRLIHVVMCYEPVTGKSFLDSVFLNKKRAYRYAYDLKDAYHVLNVYSMRGK